MTYGCEIWTMTIQSFRDVRNPANSTRVMDSQMHKPVGTGKGRS